MRKVNEDKFVSYTIVRNGSQVTFFRFLDVLRIWKDYGAGSILYGNKPNGERAILDSK
jgi:hypothetical protein